ncbi:MAG: hypothetical protein OEY64_03125 [Nitrospinota bacterium]|nr:hypothetical protein [Nitrospinota bacterium]
MSEQEKFYAFLNEMLEAFRVVGGVFAGLFLVFVALIVYWGNERKIKVLISKIRMRIK